MLAFILGLIKFFPNIREHDVDVEESSARPWASTAIILLQCSILDLSNFFQSLTEPGPEYCKPQNHEFRYNI